MSCGCDVAPTLISVGVFFGVLVVLAGGTVLWFGGPVGGRTCRGGQ